MKKYPINLLVVVFLTLMLYFIVQMSVPVSSGNLPSEVVIKKGTSFSRAAWILKKNGLLRDPYPFIALARIGGFQGSLKPGYYSFAGRITPWGIFKMLTRGAVVVNTVTVVEGDSLLEIKGKLISAGVMNGNTFDGLVADKGFLRALGVDAPSLEGYLFPDTYGFYKGAGPEEVLETMVRTLWEKYDDELMARTRELGLSMREAITLASIIEKESRVDDERSVISAVYHNRLRKGMRLQADPTSIYGIKPQSAGVTAKDIRRRTPYNTYHIKGLPPGPIASPGIKSIRAALYPADVPYLFFVASEGGTHVFSSTMREHNKAVREYRRLMRTRSKG